MVYGCCGQTLREEGRERRREPKFFPPEFSSKTGSRTPGAIAVGTPHHCTPSDILSRCVCGPTLALPALHSRPPSPRPPAAWGGVALCDQSTPVPGAAAPASTPCCRYCRRCLQRRRVSRQGRACTMQFSAQAVLLLFLNVACGTWAAIQLWHGSRRKPATRRGSATRKQPGQRWRVAAAGCVAAALVGHAACLALRAALADAERGGDATPDELSCLLCLLVLVRGTWQLPLRHAPLGCKPLQPPVLPRRHCCRRCCTGFGWIMRGCGCWPPQPPALQRWRWGQGAGE